MSEPVGVHKVETENPKPNRTNPWWVVGVVFLGLMASVVAASVLRGLYVMALAAWTQDINVMGGFDIINVGAAALALIFASMFCWEGAWEYGDKRYVSPSGKYTNSRFGE